ncbi:MAG TPA: EAL domain-containing protein [Devosia sp.]|nr:EAL domain-containing protein [Devosia sp.]
MSAVVLALASLTFIGVLISYGRDFERMVRRKTLIDAERVRAENLNRTNRKLANEDSLTGLANRRHFFNLFEEAERNMELGQLDGLFVGILGLDGFRSVNDVYGHRVGDDVLGVVGQRLRDVMCRGVTIARLGGDQFGILVRSEQKLVVLQELGNRICEAVKAPMEVNGIRVEISGSVGLAKWEGVQDTSRSLFEKADFALCRAKRDARGSAVIFNAAHAAMMRERSGVDRLMREGAFEKELSLVFQPLVCTKKGKTVGFEVLARWISSEMGFISPDIFIASAERNGMINRVTAVLLDKALQEAQTWPQDVFMSFNLSAHDIMSGAAILNLISIVRSSGFDPRRITFEVTETAIMENFEQGMQSLSLLKNLGCRIALDDFGTGYSSLAYVRSLPLDKLKLDRSFITDIEHDEGACSIVHTMVEMCQSLELECIIEGVETRGQLGILNAMGGHIIQGYFFSRPLPAKQALAYLREEGEVRLAS